MSSLIDKGRDFEAWRFATNALYDRDDEIRTDGFIVLLRLTTKEVNYAPARELVEQLLVHCRSLVYEEQDSLIWLYGSMEAHNRGTANIDAYKKSMAFADVAQRKGRLPAMAVSFCNMLLDSSDTGNRRPAMAILLVASHLSTADKKWALARCQQQMHKLSSDKTTIWAILYETLTGRFLASLR